MAGVAGVNNPVTRKSPPRPISNLYHVVRIMNDSLRYDWPDYIFLTFQTGEIRSLTYFADILYVHSLPVWEENNPSESELRGISTKEIIASINEI